jgi:hypothetical protein
LNWSLPSAAIRLIETPGRGGKLPEVWSWGYDLPKLNLPAAERWVSVGVAALLLVAGALAVRRTGLPERGLAGAALLTLAVAAAPISWWHYPILHYPGIAMLLTGDARRRRPARFGLTLAVAACTYLVPDSVLRFYFHQHERWPDYRWAMQFWAALPAVASLILFGLLLSRLRQGHAGHVK